MRPEDDGYVLAFTLPKGSFATSVLREVMKTEVDAPGAGPDTTDEGEAGDGE